VHPAGVQISFDAGTSDRALGSRCPTLNVSDIAVTLTSIERFLTEDDDDGEEEADQG
jgi:hypothetical protein